MEIISISLEKEKIEELKEAMELSGIKSRSKLIRQAMGEFVSRQKSLSEMGGERTVIFMITHSHSHKSDATSATRGYENIVKTVLHHHSSRGCLDILITQGDAPKIRELYKKIQGLGGVAGVNFSII